MTPLEHPHPILAALALAIPGLPALACLALGLHGLFGGAPRPERTLTLVGLSLGLAFLATATLSLAMLTGGHDRLLVEAGTWLTTGEYRFRVRFLVDHLSLPFLLLSTGLLGLVGNFSGRYLRDEPGLTRFFFLLLLFTTGILTTFAAASLDLLFAGWELVGLTSALLIGFFWKRAGPVEGALRAFATYRLCDLGLLAAAAVLHHHLGSASYDAYLGAASWPAGVTPLAPDGARWVAGLLIFAALGKSAQVPFSGWLPRAMEGPTPSSAIFYGALSVHAGAYLLLRHAPLLDRAPGARAALMAIGIASALHGTFVGRVQTEVKTALAYASIAQLGLVFVEIGAGFRLLALAHVVGHACLRTVQLLRAPSALQDHHRIEAAAGPGAGVAWPGPEGWLPAGARRWLYRFALERGYHDDLLEHGVVRPLLRFSTWLDAREQQWVRWAAGAPPSPRGDP